MPTEIWGIKIDYPLVDFAMKNGDIPSFFVCLPEGKTIPFACHRTASYWQGPVGVVTVVRVRVLEIDSLDILSWW